MTNVVDGYEIRVRQSGAREARKAIDDIGTAAQGAVG